MSNAYGKPLYGHASAETAYMVDDYPYGFRKRCRIRYWLESDPKKGFRFVSQTEDPVKLRWNAPKKSTYSEWGGAMYLDGNDHVQWADVNQYSKSPDVARFVAAFPKADMTILRKVAGMKVAYHRGIISGKLVWKINGVAKPPTETELGEHRAEAEAWEAIKRSL